MTKRAGRPDMDAVGSVSSAATAATTTAALVACPAALSASGKVISGSWGAAHVGGAGRADAADQRASGQGVCRAGEQQHGKAEDELLVVHGGPRSDVPRSDNDGERQA